MLRRGSAPGPGEAVDRPEGQEADEPGNDFGVSANHLARWRLDHSAPGAKVSHVFGSPLRKPWLSHFCRLAAEPCVQLSGET